METKAFQAESKRLMDLMVNAIYTNKEIFLRELISNASDAIDKAYYCALKDGKTGFSKDDYAIRLTINKDARTLTIEDGGIGMTPEELETNLGTIAKSGSLDFKQNQELEEDHDIIGQFGVGFYASFMVAEEVVVESKTAAGDAYRWRSKGAEGYSIEPCEKASTGTVITLHIRNNVEEDDRFDDYLNEHTIKSLVRRYSDFISYPIVMLCEKSKENGEDADGNPVYETFFEDDTLNSMVPIWRKNKNELTDDDYQAFYHDRHFGFDEPLRHMHLQAEGTTSYKAILYIPGQAPYDFYTKDYAKGLALYANGVLIMDKCADLVPDYYSFVKGVVDSEDLSLNISREMLQQDRQLRLISRKIDERITRELKSMLEGDRDKYELFYQAFGDQLKAGVYDQYGMHKEKLQDLLLFYSSSEKKYVTLREYADRMKEDQNHIYYATGTSIAQIDKLPQVAIIKNRGYEVLYFEKNYDEFVIKSINAYQEKTFRSASAGDLGLGERTETPKDEALVKTESDDALLKKMGELLDGEVVRVQTTENLVDDIAYLSTEGEISIDMEKMMNAMPQGGHVTAQKVLEINANHPVYARLKTFIDGNDDENLALFTDILYNQARLIAGLPVEDPTLFGQKLAKLLS